MKILRFEPKVESPRVDGFVFLAFSSQHARTLWEARLEVLLGVERPLGRAPRDVQPLGHRAPGGALRRREKL